MSEDYSKSSVAEQKKRIAEVQARIVRRGAVRVPRLEPEREPKRNPSFWERIKSVWR